MKILTDSQMVSLTADSSRNRQIFAERGSATYDCTNMSSRRQTVDLVSAGGRGADVCLASWFFAKHVCLSLSPSLCLSLFTSVSLSLSLSVYLSLSVPLCPSLSRKLQFSKKSELVRSTFYRSKIPGPLRATFQFPTSLMILTFLF